jgi:hypothetical protein
MSSHVPRHLHLLPAGSYSCSSSGSRRGKPRLEAYIGATWVHGGRTQTCGIMCVGTGTWSFLAAHNLCSLVSICTLPVWSLEANGEKAMLFSVGQCTSFSGVAASTNFLCWLGAMRPPRREVVCWRIKDISLYDPQAYGPHTFFTTGFPRFLSIHGARGLQAFDLPSHSSYSNLTMIKLENS